MVVSSTILVSYNLTDYSVLESIDLLTEKKRSVETFDEEFKKYLLHNEYFEYDDKYVLVESFKIPDTTYTYVECLPWDNSDLNIEYHLECFESTNSGLINKFRDEIFLCKSSNGVEETYKEDTYVLFENIVDDGTSNDRYLNVIVEKENIIFSVEIYTTEEVIIKLGKNRIIDDIIQNYINLTNQGNASKTD